MNTLLKVARYHLVQPIPFLVVAWGIVAFSFAVNVIVYAFAPTSHPAGAGGVPAGRYTGALASLFVYFMVLGVNSIGRWLPFGLALGASRRSYYAGTALLAAGLAVVDGLVLAVLQVIERATDGWGVQMGFFRIPYLLSGPWYLTWLSSFVWLTLLFVYGMWYGIVFRRWGLIGTIAFIAAQAAVLVAAGLLVTRANGWAGVGHFFTGLTATGLTGVLAVLAVALLAGGQATIRRAAI
ncbi:MAG: ABC transporter permease [Actinobacteria bacterium]|nr:ABC transporter permease [Actinomycetota bacterium]